MSDPFTAAYAEAEASCPIDALSFVTLELQHPSFVEDGIQIALRFVLDVRPRSFGIEVGALFGGGTMQAFTPVAFRAERPEFGQGKVPQCRVTIDNVARQLTPYLNAAVTVAADLILVYREYREDDVSEPCYGPVEFVVKQVVASGASVTGTASLADLTNKKFPSRVFSRAEWPALMAA
ncbi:MAG: hypothetical protein B7Y12_02205 [Rhizobiales bacterium 24-66-13]|jgi:hypothetical protein|nr:MAG: hypothetical protein B7Y61_01235 [Rhizobiales bacterium 35-66-30]OYZ82827.1 MAG: hypothetical protein B7Y12_02205 [Rhizobiales bacterium 24-66-13]OZB11860.1 MAG: hypothetical protein B7X67_02185 [Rhizobiales bacterium 39-66-18]HQS08714.1 DUF1833 family protein [Xanthobacteraceae bacterium]HQS45915.1 DUF1833 family protein [Xanthobacteraceae bacterium]